MARTHGAFRLRDVDRGFAKLIREGKDLAAQRGMVVKGGILGAKAEEEHPGEDEAGKKPTNIELACIHEFGVPGRIPARPFILGTFELHRAEYWAALRKLAGTWFDRATGRGGMPLRQALGIMGLKMTSDMKSRVITGTGIPPPNAPSTIRQKLAKGEWKGRSEEETDAMMAAGKGPRPLVDTGRMVGAISHEVQDGKGGAA